MASSAITHPKALALISSASGGDLVIRVANILGASTGVSPYSSYCKGHTPGTTREGVLKQIGENTEEQSASPEESPVGPSTGVKGTAKGNLCNATPQIFLQPAALPTATLESISKNKNSFESQENTGCVAWLKAPG